MDRVRVPALRFLGLSFLLCKMVIFIATLKKGCFENDTSFCLWVAENSAWHCPHSLNVSSYCHYLTFSQPGTFPSLCGDWVSQPMVRLGEQENEAVGTAWGRGAVCVSRAGPSLSFLLPSNEQLGHFVPPAVRSHCAKFERLKMKRDIFSWPRDSWWFSPFCNDVFTSGWNSPNPRRGERIQVKRVLVSFSGGFGSPLSS